MRFLIYIILTFSFTPLAFSQGKIQAKVLGWENDFLVVQVNEKGEADNEEGIPTPYRFETVEIFDYNNTRTRILLKNAKGPIPYHVAQKAVKGDLGPLLASKKGAISLSSTFGVNIVQTKERRFNKAGIRCLVNEHIYMFDVSTKQIFEVDSRVYEGERGKSRNPICPVVNTTRYWREDEKAFALIRIVDGKLSVANVNLNLLRKKAKSRNFLAFVNPVMNAKWLLDDSDWSKIVQGIKTGPKELKERKDTLGTLAYAWAKIRNNEISRGKKIAKKTLKSMKKTSLNYALAALVFREANALKVTAKILDKVIKKSKNFEELLEIANLFYAFDLDVAAQLYVAALSRDDAKKSDVSLGYSMLLRTLLDSGNMNGAKQVVEKFENMGDQFALQVMRYRVLHRDKEVKKDIINYIKENPNHCEAYWILARTQTHAKPRAAVLNYKNALLCDPEQGEAIYLLADLEKRAGRRAEANVLFDRYRKVAKRRKGDTIRDARRQYAYDLTHKKSDEKKKLKEKK